MLPEIIAESAILLLLTAPEAKLNQSTTPDAIFPLIIKSSNNLSLVIVPEAMW